MKKVWPFLIFLSLFFPSLASAQQPAPANVGVVRGSPDVFKLQDTSGAWSTFGTVNASHVFTPNVNGLITTNNCLKWGPGITDAGAPCGSGGGSPLTVNGINPVTNMTFSGAGVSVSGTTPNATVTIPGGGTGTSPIINAQAQGFDAGGIVDNTAAAVALMATLNGGTSGTTEVFFPYVLGTGKYSDYYFASPFEETVKANIDCGSKPGGGGDSSVRLIFAAGVDGIDMLTLNESTQFAGGSQGGGKLDNCGIISLGRGTGTGANGATTITNARPIDPGVGAGISNVQPSVWHNGDGIVAVQAGNTGYDIIVTSATGNGTNATLGFTSYALAPQVGDLIDVSDVTPTGYNCTRCAIISSTAGTISPPVNGTITYANTTTAPLSNASQGRIDSSNFYALNPGAFVSSVSGTFPYTLSLSQTPISYVINTPANGEPSGPLVLWQLPSSQKYTVETRIGSSVAIVTAGPRPLRPGDFIWSDAFPFGTEVASMDALHGGYSITSASASAGNATLTFVDFGLPAGLTGNITITGMTPTGYNCTNCPIISSTTTSVTYASGGTGPMTVSGHIDMANYLTFPEVISVTDSLVRIGLGFVPATTGASNPSGSAAILTFPAQDTPLGQYVTVTGMTPSSYNCSNCALISSSTTSVTYASAGTGAQTVAGTIGTGFSIANVTHTAGSPGQMWKLPTGIMRRGVQMQTDGDYVANWFIGAQSPCSSGLFPGQGCNDNIDIGSQYTQNYIGRLTQGNNTNVSSYMNNVFAHNYYVDYLEGGSLGSSSWGENSNSSEDQSSLYAFMTACGSENFSGFYGSYLGIANPVPPGCMDPNGFIGTPTQSGFGPMYVNPQTQPPTDSTVLRRDGVTGSYKFDSFNQPVGANYAFCLGTSTTLLWGFSSNSCDTVHTWRWNYDPTNFVWNLGYGSSNEIEERLTEPSYVGYNGGGPYALFTSGILLASEVASALGDERNLEISPTKPTASFHEQGDISFNRNAVAGGNVGWIDIATGNNFVPFGNIPSNGTTSGAAGTIGEVIQADVPIGSAVTGFTSGSAKTITSAALTAGDWDCRGSVDTAPAGTTTTSSIAGGLSTTTNVFPTANETNGIQSLSQVIPAGIGASVQVGSWQYLFSAPTTLFLVGQVNFAVSTMSMYGAIQCRRMR